MCRRPKAPWRYVAHFIHPARIYYQLAIFILEPLDFFSFFAPGSCLKSVMLDLFPSSHPASSLHISVPLDQRHTTPYQSLKTEPDTQKIETRTAFYASPTTRSWAAPDYRIDQLMMLANHPRTMLTTESVLRTPYYECRSKHLKHKCRYQFNVARSNFLGVVGAEHLNR